VRGIYQITNIVNNKFYIGSAVSVKNRWQRHIKALRNNEHYNSRLQNAWNKYG
jgi:group I intron endonuclease